MQAVDMQAVHSRCPSCHASAMAKISRGSVDATGDFWSSSSDILCPIRQAPLTEEHNSPQASPAMKNGPTQRAS